jgi:hypothetical protein
MIQEKVCGIIGISRSSLENKPSPFQDIGTTTRAEGSDRGKVKGGLKHPFVYDIHPVLSLQITTRCQGSGFLPDNVATLWGGEGGSRTAGRSGGGIGGARVARRVTHFAVAVRGDLGRADLIPLPFRGAGAFTFTGIKTG